MTVDYSNDYLFWSQTEAVTVTLGRSSDTDVSVSIAYREDVRHDQPTFAGVAIGTDDLLWNIPAALLGASNELKEDDLITDSSGAVWLVRSAVKINVGASTSHWQALCKKRRA